MTLSQTHHSKTKISLKFKTYAYVRCIQWQYTWRMHNKFTIQYSKCTNMLTFKKIFVVQIDAWNMYVIVKGRCATDDYCRSQCPVCSHSRSVHLPQSRLWFTLCVSASFSRQLLLSTSIFHEPFLVFTTPTLTTI